MPAIPPILDTPNSRMIYHDLSDDEVTTLTTIDESAWQAISAAILDSQQGYPDTTIIEVKLLLIEL